VRGYGKSSESRTTPAKTPRVNDDFSSATQGVAGAEVIPFNQRQ
jgi:hypothetical protein